MSAHDVLFPGDHDPMRAYQRDAEEAIEKEARERQEARERSTESRTIAQLRSELAELRAYVVERDQEYLKINESMIKGLDTIESWTRKTIELRVQHSEAEMCARIAERFGELRGWISAIDPARARAVKGEAFRFASEKSAGESDAQPVDLPNPPPSRRAID